MFHILDEAEERGEQMAKAAEKYKPKTEEEQKKEAQGEAAGTDSFQKQSYSRNCPTRNCRKNNRDISRLTCGHNKSRYFTDACLG